MLFTREFLQTTRIVLVFINGFGQISKGVGGVSVVYDLFLPISIVKSQKFSNIQAQKNYPGEGKIASITPPPKNRY